ncbi:hypothetical protein M0813_29885 [Anaeramoeba flamelloides]|uniref:Ubiquitin-like domain-containing protein n=1 Tax=Anaeramoeba flamelloides TaxID=1746091 RepID=A0ABQ8XLQ6_9EUKA|nr:hypothetical protein M0813_29885 [Anaeramoeba flamelloides]
MDQELIDLVNGRYQRCPHCNKHNAILSLGIGFQVCKCKQIYCLFCGAEHENRTQAFSHFISVHEGSYFGVHTNGLNELVETLQDPERKTTVFISLEALSTFPLRVSLNDRVSDLQEKIQKQISVSVSTQRLVFNGVRLSQPENTLESYKINDRSTIKLYVLTRGGINRSSFYKIYTLNRKVIWVKVNRRDTISSIKPMVAKKLKIEESNQIYYSETKVIEDTALIVNLNPNVYNLFVVSKEQRAKSKNLFGFVQDFNLLFKREERTDFEIGGKKVHSFLLEYRTGIEPKDLKNTLEDNFQPEDIHLFLKWVYTGLGISIEKVNTIVEHLQIIEKASSRSLTDDISLLLDDDKSKDFKIVFKENYNDENPFIFPVHSLVLQARSGLYRGLFANVTELEDSVIDFSEKSFDAFEIFIRFVYTNKITLKNIKVTNELLDELRDIHDFYQLNENSSFNLQLEKIVKEHKKN